MTNYNAAFFSERELAAMPFAAQGTNVLVDTSVRLIGIENISLGSNLRIDAGTIIVASGPVTIGSYVHIGVNCYLEGRGGIEIEDFSNISSYVSLHSVSDDPSGASLTNPMTPKRFKALHVAKIFLRRHSLIFTKSVLLPGTEVGEGAVIGAHSLARGTIPPWTINGGVPTHYIKDRKRDLIKLEMAMFKEQES